MTRAWKAIGKKCHANIDSESISTMTTKEGVVGEKEDTKSLSVGRLVKDPDGGTKVARAKSALITTWKEEGMQSRNTSTVKLSANERELTIVPMC